MYSERRCSPVCFLSTKTEGKAGSVVHGSLPLRSQQQGPACCSLSRGTGRSTTTSPSHLAGGGWGSSRSTPGLAEGRSGGPGGGAEARPGGAAAPYMGMAAANAARAGRRLEPGRGPAGGGAARGGLRRTKSGPRRQIWQREPEGFTIAAGGRRAASCGSRSGAKG